MSKRTRARNPANKAASPTKLDLGCGPNKKPGFFGVDAIAFPGVDLVFDITSGPWPFKDNSVEEFHCSHVLEHLTNLGGKWERVRFFNELHRVLKPGGKGQLIIPHWASMRYYGDPTHKEPFSEFGFYYLLRSWRVGGPMRGQPANAQPSGANAPHADAAHNPEGGYSCDLDVVWGHSLHPDLVNRNEEYRQNALKFYKDAAQDLIANISKPLA